MNRITAIFILAALLAATGLCAAVERDVWVFEDFSSGAFPPAGWTISAHASNWGESASANTGGQAPELRFSWSPQFSGDSYFISPSYDTSGETTIYLDFRHFVDHYSPPFTIGAATRSDGGAWNTVWSISPTGNVGPQLQTVEISNADVGSVDFQFALFFSGTSYNIDYWYVDDVKLYTPFPNDFAILGTYILNHMDAGLLITPACEIKNVGLNTLTAMVSLFIYRGDELEASHPDYYSAWLESGQSETATFPDFTPSLPDELYRFEFSVTSLENVPDDDPDNNYMEAWLNTWTGARQMVVLEIGTGGWCPYCPGAAMGADDFIDQGYNVAVIENHNGDPYANDTSNARNAYYGISGYPTAIFDGVLSYMGGSNTTSVFPSYLPLYQLRDAIDTPLDIFIYGEETRENYDITIRLDKYAPIHWENAVMHLAITESDILYNWQGQDHFNFVDRMMYPTWEGTPIDLVNAPMGTTDMTLQIAKDATWETANCELVAFIQNLDTKEILQGNKIALTDLVPPVSNDDLVETVQTSLGALSPNPFADEVSIAYTLKGAAPVSIGIYNVRGQLVRKLVSEEKAAGSHEISWDGSDAAGARVSNGAYLVRLESGGEISTRKVMLIR